jgi:hypothetical protein
VIETTGRGEWIFRGDVTGVLCTSLIMREFYLYAVDGGFFPSSAAVNPALTIMANALRVGDHLRTRLK